MSSSSWTGSFELAGNKRKRSIICSIGEYDIICDELCDGADRPASKYSRQLSYIIVCISSMIASMP